SFSQCIHGAVERVVAWVFIQQASERKLMRALLSEILRGVELALHHVELAIHFFYAAFWFNYDQAVHTIGDMLIHHRCGTVVYKQTWCHRFKGKALGFTWCHLCYCSTATWACYGVEIHRVNVITVFSVCKLNCNLIPYTCTHHWAGYSVVKGPVFVGAAVGELAY